MTASDRPSGDRLVELVDRGEYEDAIARIEQLADAPTDDRTAAVRSLRSIASDRPTALDPVVPALASFLEDEERSIRLTTAKLFVAIADGAPEALVGIVPTLTDRLAVDDELYYVRARLAEALGAVALEAPDAVASPEFLAEVRVELEFARPEVKRELARALERVAVADPGRLRGSLSELAERSADPDERVRYHLLTAMVAVGCEHPESLDACADTVAARLDDESEFVRARAAEAIGLLARASTADAARPVARLETMAEAERTFVADRAVFALEAVDDGVDAETRDDEVGTLEAVRRTTDDIGTEIEGDDGDHECPHCGGTLPPFGPPLCPACGRSP